MNATFEVNFAYHVHKQFPMPPVIESLHASAGAENKEAVIDNIIDHVFFPRVMAPQISVKVHVPTTEDIKCAIKDMGVRSAKHVPMKNVKIAKDDIAVVTFKGNNSVIGECENSFIRIGRRTCPQLEKFLIGVKAGYCGDVVIEDFGSINLKVLEVQKFVYPSDEEMAADCAFDTVENYYAAIAESLQKQFKDKADFQYRLKFYDDVYQKIEHTSIPEFLIEPELKFVKRMCPNEKTSVHEYLAYRRVKLQLFFHKIRKHTGILGNFKMLELAVEKYYGLRN